MNNIIFLDIDGVLNNYSLIRNYGLDYIDNDMVKILKNIVNITNSKIVLSSTWRKKATDRLLVKSSLALEGMNFIDCTSVRSFDDRCDEINDWLIANKETVFNFIILDDDPDASNDNLSKHFFQTDGDIGLTNEIAQQAINFLNLGLQI